MRAAQGGPSVRYRDYARCLPDYLRAQAERAYSRRNSAIAKLTTEAAIAGAHAVEAANPRIVRKGRLPRGKVVYESDFRSDSSR